MKLPIARGLCDVLSAECVARPCLARIIAEWVESAP